MPKKSNVGDEKSNENLKRYGYEKPPLSREEAEKIGKKGGKNSVIKRRGNKALKDIATQQLEVITKGNSTAKEHGIARAISIMCNAKKDIDALRALEVIAKIIGEDFNRPNDFGKDKEVVSALDAIMEAFKYG